MSEAIWGTVIGGLILGVLAWVWSQRVLLRNWWARQMAAADELEEIAEDEQLETLRDQVADRARNIGKRLPVSASGNRVTYTDGTTTTFIADYQTYRSAMESRRVDLLRTVNADPPTPLSRRGRAWLEQWLTAHPEL